MTSSHDVLASLWTEIGLPADVLLHITLSGDDPVLPSSFRVGTAAQVSIGAAALAAAEIWRARTGQQQQVTVPMRAAAVEFRSEHYLRVNGNHAPELWDKIAGIYQCGDGGWVRIHTNFPHHRDGILKLLGCAYEREFVQAALDKWDAGAFEAAAAEVGLVVARKRSFTEWDARPQGRAVAALPVLTITRIGDADPMPFLAGPERPLDGVRVLDLTRVIAGPVCGRTLAAHGADVLMVTAPHLPSMPPLVIDTGRGKRSTSVDLREAEGRQTLARLLAQSDVIVQSYRPGALARHQFGPEDAARMHPGIVYVSLSAYSHAGPWASRRGFDSIVQTASGFNEAEAQAAGETKPKVLPCQVLDHASGYLMALGAMAALLRRAHEGGSWHVQVSLAQTAHWLRGLGRIPNGFAYADPTFDDVADLLEETPSGFGQLLTVRHAASLSQTPPRWTRPSVPLGTDPPVW